MAEPKEKNAPAAPAAPAPAPKVDPSADFKIQTLSFARPCSFKKIGACDAITTGKAKGGAKHVESITKVTGGFNVLWHSKGMVNGVPRTANVSTALFSAFIPFGNVLCAQSESVGE
jgi:hypothetical protein